MIVCSIKRKHSFIEIDCDSHNYMKRIKMYVDIWYLICGYECVNIDIIPVELTFHLMDTIKFVKVCHVNGLLLLAIDFERILSMTQQTTTWNLLKSLKTFISFYQFRALKSSLFVNIFKHLILGLKQYLVDTNGKLNNQCSVVFCVAEDRKW